MNKFIKDIKSLQKFIFDINLEKEISIRALLEKYKIENIENYLKLFENSSDKGNYGKLFEKVLTGNNPNNSSLPDLFGEIEIKTVPLKKRSKKEKLDDLFVAKERLVLKHINYTKIVEQENFYASDLYIKCKNMLLCFYFNDNEKDMLDYKILGIYFVSFDRLDKLDEIINDYQIILNKVKDGKAHEISGSDTKILEALTKGQSKETVSIQPYSNIEAKKRAFGFKNKYVTELFYNLYKKDNTIKKFWDFKDIKDQLMKYKDKPIFEIQTEFNSYDCSKSNKFSLVLKMLGVEKLSEIEYFVKKNAYLRNIILNEDLENLKEEIMLSKLKNIELNDKNLTFYDSEIYDLIERPFVFVIFKKVRGIDVLHDVVEFKFSNEDIKKAEFVYNHTKDLFLNGGTVQSKGKIDKYNFIKISDKKMFHIRPKAANKSETYETKYGETITKQAFWFNKKDFMEWYKKNS